VFFRPKHAKTYALLKRSGLAVEPPGAA